MKIEEQVLSRKQMAHLQELGVDTSDASMIWVVNKENPSIVSIDVNDPLPYVGNCACDFIPTYTIGDLIEKLPEDLRFRCQGSNYSFSKNWDSLSFGYERIIPHSNNLIEGLFTLLCWLAENHKELL